MAQTKSSSAPNSAGSSPPQTAQSIVDLIGNTPMLRIPSLSQLSGCDIFLKCENLNPGGSVKDRAALGMIKDGFASGRLKPGMTIVEGTAGNTGIGLALVGRSFGLDSLICMPDNQSPQKVAILKMFGAQVNLTKPVPFKDENHFFHTAGRIAAQDPKKYWWANQFDNLANFRAHYTTTGPEIFHQIGGKLDYLVSVAGTGGTIAGNSRYLKEKIPALKVVLCDPFGSGLCNYFHKKVFEMSGSSFSEGIGIMRLVPNFAEAQVDEAFTLPDADAVTVAHHLRKVDGIVLGTSAALNVAACLKVALRDGPGKRLVTFWCDQGDRSIAKLYDDTFLASQTIDASVLTVDDLVTQYRH